MSALRLNRSNNEEQEKNLRKREDYTHEQN